MPTRSNRICGLQSVISWILLWLLLASIACAQDLAPVPALERRVTDLTNTLSAQQTVEIEQTLRAFEQHQGSQVAVLIVPTTRPEAIEQYSIRVVEAWRLGRKQIDDGALLLVAKQDRQLRIEVGYGLEGALTDATSKRIIAEIITPHFRNDDFFGGIRAGVQQMMKVIAGEPLPAPAPEASESADSPAATLPGIMFFAFFVGQMFRGVVGRFPAALGTGVVSTGLVWVLVGSLMGALLCGLAIFGILLFSGGSGSRRFGRGAYYMGSGFPGGGGGGGFSGGGGGFGGGGASGRW